MKLSDFRYHLPNELIARFPLEQRTESRLLCLNASSGEVQHKKFKDLSTLLRPNDLLVFNNTKVIPARVYGKKKTGGRVELLVERILTGNTALVMLKVSKSPQVNTIICFEGAAQATVKERQGQFYILEFNCNVRDFLEEQGEIPLPPYINRKADAADNERYQTVYAEHEGAVAAPTAGLHFDEAMLKTLNKEGIKSTFVTLHVGAGTFQPVRVENVKDHDMHAEYIDVSKETCNIIEETKKVGGRIIAVGTTSVRSLETAAASGQIKPFQGDSTIFIYPGYEFKVVDAMVTNFHLPESTLLMLISAFANRDMILKTYEEAVNEKYRFFSYGDAMFISK